MAKDPGGGGGFYKPRKKQYDPRQLADKLRATRQNKLQGGQWGKAPRYTPPPAKLRERGYTPPMDQEQTVQAMPNYNKLTPAERWIYGKLPGFSESTVGKALERFSGSWAGKALGVLDVAAEGLERSVGVLSQIEYDQRQADPAFADPNLPAVTDPIDTWKELQDAWYAGSLASDVWNMPHLKRDEDGKITGIQIPQDLPGQAGLAEARRKISEGIPLEQVRAEMYQDMGALQLRAQLQDTWFHALGDPLNYVLPMLAPVERVNAARSAIVGGSKISKASLEALQAAEEAARVAGKIDDAAKIADKIATSQLLTKTDRFVLALSGGDPLVVPTTRGGKLLQSRFNPFSLTPAARSHELLTMVSDHVGYHILANLDDPEEIVSAINRGLKGVLGQEFGHAFINLEGRTAQAALAGFDAHATDMLNAWRKTAKDRVLLEDLAKLSGDDVDNLLNKIIDASQKGKEPELAALARQLGVTDPKDLKKLGKVFEEIPHDAKTFKLVLTNKIADHTAQQGVAMFGVQARGMIEKMSLAMKSAETMAFLRLNPAYAIRNVVNNEFTMLARGLVGRVMGKNIDDIWGRVGYTPIRLSQGFGAMGADVGAVATKAGEFAAKEAGEIGGKAIYEALRGESGYLDKFSDFVNGFSLGKADVSKMAAGFESSASKRAMTIGYLEGMRKYYWKPGKGFDFTRDFMKADVYDGIRASNPEIIEALHKAAQDALSPDEIDDAVRGNLNISMTGMLDDASERLGYDVRDVLTPDFIATHEKALKEAAELGPSAVREYVVRMKTDIETHLDEFMLPRVNQIASEVEAKIQAEGMGAVMPIFSDQVDQFWFAHQAYARRMESVQDQIGRGLGAKAYNEQWLKVKAENTAFWNRTWKEFEASLKGLRKGAKNKGFDLPEEIEQSFGLIEKKYKTFFKTRDELQEAFFEARLEGRTPDLKWSEIEDQVDGLYREMIDYEDAIHAEIDDVAARAVPQEMRDAFIQWRRKARDLRREDKSLVVEFRKQVRQVKNGIEKENMWAKFWQDRRARWVELWQNDRAGLSAMSGGSTGRQVFEEPVARAAAYDELDDILANLKTREPNDREFEILEMLKEEASHETRRAIDDIERQLEAPPMLDSRAEKEFKGNLLDDYARLLREVKDEVQGTPPGKAFDSFLDEAKAVSTDELVQKRKLASLYGVPSDQAVGGDKRIVDAVNQYSQTKMNRLQVTQENIPVSRIEGKEFQINEATGQLDVEPVKRKYVDEYTAKFEAGEVPPPIDVYAPRPDVDEPYQMYEGHRRVLAAQRAGVEELPANVYAVDAEGNVITVAYESLDEIPLDEIDQALKVRAVNKGLPTEPVKSVRQEVRQQVRREIPAAVWEKDQKRLFDEWATNSTPAIDSRVAEAIEYWADTFKGTLDYAQPGKRVSKYETTAPGVTFEGIESGFGFDWWNKLPSPKGKKSVLKALEQIAAPTVHDQGTLVTRLKRVILDMIGPGGKYEDPRVLLTLGDEQGAYRILLKELEDEVDLVKKYPSSYQQFYDLMQKDPNDLRQLARNTSLKREGEFSIFDLDKISKPEPPIGKGEDQFWLAKGWESLDALGESAIDAARKPALKWDDVLDDAGKAEVNRWVGHVKGQMSDARYQAGRYAEYRRDSALLNYTRRYNYNTWLGTIAPFEFWATQSMAKWAIHSIDRPAMLSTYLRMKKMLETAGAPNQQIPSRLKGALRIAVPFMPDWMQNKIYVDPMRMALPFDQFTFGYEEMMNKQNTLEGRTFRLIEQAQADGNLTAYQANEAIRTMSGETWEKYRTMALQNDEELKFDAVDFVTLMTPPHAPLMWAKEIAEGTPEDIAPFTPMSRSLKGVAGLLGIDWDSHPLNMEAKLRKSLGLPAFDKWDDYRVERMLSNLAATGDISADEALRSMITHDQTGEQDEAWKLALERANKEFGISALGSSLGIPIKSYPEGEHLQRNLKDDFDRAYQAKLEGDPEQLKIFFELHPEYEDRLALFKKPEDRLRSFLIDEIWDTYRNMPSLNKKEVRDQLGDQFFDKFLNKDTRSYDSIDLDQMQVWLALLGGETPGKLESQIDPLKITDPDIAWRAQTFYNERTQYFPNFYDEQKAYFELQKGNARKAYLKNHPNLIQYWDWRNDWLHRNPDVTPYLDDDYEFKYESEAAREEAYANQPDFTWEEWQTVLDPSAINLITYSANGNELPRGAREALSDIANKMGLDYEDMLERVYGSMGAQVPPDYGYMDRSNAAIDTAGGGGGASEDWVQYEDGSWGPAYVPDDMGQAWDFEADPNLTDKAKQLIRNKVHAFTPEQVSVWSSDQNVGGQAWELPPTMQHNEMMGFKQYGYWADPNRSGEQVAKHEIGHIIDFEGYMGDNPSKLADFQDDVDAWISDFQDGEPVNAQMKKNINYSEMWAHLFSVAAFDKEHLDPRFNRWFKAYIKGLD